MALLLFADGASSARAADSDLVDLMAKMKAIPASSATFTERKYLAMLSEPLESSGKLSYVAPDRIEKITLKPDSSRMTVEGGRLTVENGDGSTRDMALAEAPEILALVESIRGTLSGDLDSLKRIYKVDLKGTAEAWTLELAPKQRRVQALVQTISIAGVGASIQSVTTLERDGDRTEMVVSEDPR